MVVGQRGYVARQPTRFERVVARLDAVALKAICFCGIVFVFQWASVPLHEFGHWLVAKMLGVSGSIHFDEVTFGSWGGGFTPDKFPSSPQTEIIAFAGGGFVALVVLVAWLCLPYKRKWWVSVPLLGTVAWCLVVAIMELVSYL